MYLINKLKERIGFPFGIRGTARKYLKLKGNVPRGRSGQEGVGFGRRSGAIPTLHFFVVDDVAINSFPQHYLDSVLETTIRKSVIEHAADHAPLSYQHFKSTGRYWEEDLPVVYIFPVDDLYTRDRYKGSFSHFKGLPTFTEADSGANKLIHPAGIFQVTLDDYVKIDHDSRYFLKCATRQIKSDDELGEVHFKKRDVENIIRFYNNMYKLQDTLNCIPRKQRFKVPSEEEIIEALNDKESFLRQFNEAYRLSYIYNFYDNLIYEAFAKKIMDDIRNL